MNKVPTMISTKDKLYISDILNVTYLFAKKFDHYESMVKDKKIKDLITTSSDMLKKQYSKLMEELNYEK